MSKDCPESVTTEKIYRPSIEHTSQLSVSTTIPKSVCKVEDFQDRLGSDQLAGVWNEWRLEGESFEDYIKRIQTVDIRPTDVANNMISLKKPIYLFKDMVSTSCNYVTYLTLTLIK